MTTPAVTRCAWVTSDPLYIAYHDTEWGRAIFDDRLLFEFLILEGMQAGLSWLTILKKRAHFRQAFMGFDPQKISLFDQTKIEALMNDPGIIRNKLKIRAARQNAFAYLELLEQEKSFSEFLWQFVDGKTQMNHWDSIKQIPTKTPASEAMSKALLSRGFKFVGPTICYAFMQAVGMVMDHTTDCFCYSTLG